MGVLTIKGDIYHEQKINQRFCGVLFVKNKIKMLLSASEFIRRLIPKVLDEEKDALAKPGAVGPSLKSILCYE